MSILRGLAVLATGMLLGGAAGPATALTLIEDVSASASTYAVPQTAPNFAVDGSGLTGDAHSNFQTNRTWASALGQVDGTWYTIDLKQDFAIDPLNSLQVWNFNAAAEFGVDVTSRGIRTASFWYAADDGGAVLSGTTDPAVVFQPLGLSTTSATSGNTFDQADYSPTYTDFDVVSFNQSITARYIRILVEGGIGTGNYGDPDVVGLSEVQVFAAPEPATALLLASGLAALGWQRRSRR